MASRLTVGSLFTGIGGLDLGLERAGFDVRFQCEIDPFCIRVLEKHWPDVQRFGDVRSIGDDAPAVDLLAGGFPCQPFSVAGKQAGEADDRNLWPEMLRVVRTLRPQWVLGENVPGLLSTPYFDAILSDLERAGYEVLPLVIPAAAFGANHLRYRVFVVAHDPAQSEARREPDRSGIECDVADPSEFRGFERRRIEQCESSESSRNVHHWSIEPDVGRVAHGVPRRVDRLRALGNAVVPQVAQWIGERIMEALTPPEPPVG